MSTTTTIPEPATANGAIRVIRTRDGDYVPAQRDDTHPTAGGDAHWLDLTWLEDERTAYTWADFEPVAVSDLGEQIDPVTAEEPADGTTVVVKRVDAGTGETNWYTVRRDDAKISPVLEMLREVVGPLDEDEATDAERASRARWSLEQCFAEWRSRNWGDSYGFFGWRELGIEDHPEITATVYPIVETV